MLMFLREIAVSQNWIFFQSLGHDFYTQHFTLQNENSCETNWRVCCVRGSECSGIVGIFVDSMAEGFCLTPGE